VAYAVPRETEVLPVAGAYNFRYSRPFRLGGPDKPKVAARKPGPKPKDVQGTGGLFPPQPANRQKFGHQLSVVRPPTNLNAPQTR
jgi:hypothetical protein